MNLAQRVVARKPQASTQLENRLRIVAAVLGALGIAGLLAFIVGTNPLDVYSALWQGAFGSRAAVGETIARTVPLALIGLGLIPALRANLFPIGAEGQLAIGALAGGLMALEISTMPPVLQLVLPALCSAAAGVAWAYIPAVFRSHLGLNEILTTLAFNFIGIQILTWLLNGPIKGPGTNLPQTEALSPTAWLPVVLEGTRANAGIFVAFAVGGAMYLLTKTASGYRVKLFGLNPRLATISDINPRTIIIWTMLLAGALAGLAGWVQVAGVDRAVYTSVARGTGYLGILVAVMGGAGVLGTLVAAFLFAALETGGDFMQVAAGTSPFLVDVIQGVMLLLVASPLIRSRSVYG